MNTSFLFLFVQLTNIYKNVTLLCPPENLTENNQLGYEITPPLPTCITDTAVETKCT